MTSFVIDSSEDMSAAINLLQKALAEAKSTLRDQLAMAALPAILGKVLVTELTVNTIQAAHGYKDASRAAYHAADAMLQAREGR